MKQTSLFFIVLLFCATISQSKAQTCCPYIMPIEILPSANPSTSDSVKVVIQVTTPNWGEKINLSHSINQNNIQIEACYYQTLLTVVRTFTDTLSLGVLPAGNYNVSLFAALSYDETKCIVIDSTSSTNTASTTFVVSSPTDIDNPQKTRISLFPNPVQDAFTLESQGEINKLSIYDTQGREIKVFTQPTSSINVESLPAGLYRICIDSENKREVISFVKD